jgi:hypothetical protein
VPLDLGPGLLASGKENNGEPAVLPRVPDKAFGRHSAQPGRDDHAQVNSQCSRCIGCEAIS